MAERNQTPLETQRIASRREYLPIREYKKLRELEDEIADERELFAPEELTQKEMDELRRKEEILRLARRRIETAMVETPQYALPTTGGVVDRVVRGAEQDENEVDRYLAEKIAQGTSTTRQAEDADDEFMELLLADKRETIEQRLLEMRRRQIAAPRKRTRQEELADVRKTLPVYHQRDDFLKLVRAHRVVIVAGETGSGKTTQLPQYLYEDGYCQHGKVGVTQPRRVAAMSIARRVAEEVGTRLGGIVGYTIRFEDVSSDRTLIQYLTDGMLLRAFLNSPDLAEYSVVMVDEAHERTLATDILFGLLKDVVRFRPDFRLIISSATLETAKFSEYFDNAPVFLVPGRRFPVTVEYVKEPEPDPLMAAVVTTLRIHETMPLGDVLIFLTGQDEVDACVELLRERTRGLGTSMKELVICRIYSALPSDIQAQIFVPTPKNARKVVVATNIAETSITVDGIVYVIDSGYCKINQYNTRTGLESLEVVPISKASADQRAGRAGRVAPGYCFRLYTRAAFDKELPASTPPEIVRANLAGTVLMLKSLGIDDILHFDFMDPPAAEAMMRALEQLYALGAFNEDGQLTRRGRQMAEFPMAPTLSRVLLAAQEYRCTEPVATICAMLQVAAELFYRPRDKAQLADTARKAFARHEGDHLTLLGVYQAWVGAQRSESWCSENFLQARALNRADSIRTQLIELMERVDIPLVASDNTTDILKALLAGFFYNTARLTTEGVYRQCRQNRAVEIHPSSVLFGKSPRWIVYFELVLTSREFVRQVSEIVPLWLVEVAPHVFPPEEMKKYLPKKERPVPRHAC